MVDCKYNRQYDILKGADLLICEALNQELLKILNQNANLTGSSTAEKTQEISRPITSVLDRRHMLL
jgi:hypothetical protein